MSKAIARLRLAPSSRCASCGRTTKTVEGVCAECWAPKEPNARIFRPKPRTEPLLDLDWDSPWLVRAAVAVVGFIAGAVVHGLL